MERLVDMMGGTIDAESTYGIVFFVHRTSTFSIGFKRIIEECRRVSHGSYPDKFSLGLLREELRLYQIVHWPLFGQGPFVSIHHGWSACHGIQEIWG